MDELYDQSVQLTSYPSRNGEMLSTTSTSGEFIYLLADSEGIKPVGLLGSSLPDRSSAFIDRILVERSLRNSLDRPVRVGFMRYPRMSGINLELSFNGHASISNYSIGRGRPYSILATAIASPQTLIKWARDFYSAHVREVLPMHYPGYDNVLELVSGLDKDHKLLGPYACIANEIHMAQMGVLHFPFKKSITIDGKTNEIDCDILCNQVRSLDIAVRIGLISESERETILSRLSNDQKAIHVIMQGHARGEKAGAPDEDIDNLVIGDLGSIARAAIAIREGKPLPNVILDRQILILPPFSLSRRLPSAHVINFFKSNTFSTREAPHRWLRSQTLFIVEWLKSMRILEDRLTILEGTSRGALMAWYMAQYLDDVHELIMKKPAGFRRISLGDLLRTGEENVPHQRRFARMYSRVRAFNGRDVENADETELLGPPVKYIPPQNARRVTVHLNREDWIVNGSIVRSYNEPGIKLDIHYNVGGEMVNGKVRTLNETGLDETIRRFNIPGTNIVYHDGDHYTPISEDVMEVSGALNALRHVLSALPTGVNLQRRVIELQDQFGNVYCRIPV